MSTSLKSIIVYCALKFAGPTYNISVILGYVRQFGLCPEIFEIAKTIIPQFRIVQYGFINVHVHIGYAAIENAFNNRHRRINNR